MASDDINMFRKQKIEISDEALHKKQELEIARKIFKCCKFCPCCFVNAQDLREHMRAFSYEELIHKERWENLRKQRQRT